MNQEYHESFQPGRFRLRASTRHRISIVSPGKDSVLVLRRDQKARDDQLPHVQARARRSVLRAHLRADQRITQSSARQVQAHEVQRHHLRKVLRSGSTLSRAPARADGPHRACRRCAHLVPEVIAEPHWALAPHDAQRISSGIFSYFEYYVVLEPGLTLLKDRQLLS